MNQPQQQSRISVPGVILNSSIETGEDPFVNFQTNPPDEGMGDKRHYFEAVAATTEVNRNMYQFSEKALRMIAADFKKRKTLTINHLKGLTDNTLGFGATVDAVYQNGKLYVAAYISLGKTYPEGPFGNSEELRDGIIDGFINSVSQSAYPLKATDSVSGLPYPLRHSDYGKEGYSRNYRGQDVIVEEKGRKVVKTVHVIVEEAEAIELSLVQMGADRGSGVTKKAINLSLNDFVDQDHYNFLFGDGTVPDDPEIPTPAPETPEIPETPDNPAEPAEPVEPAGNEGGDPPQPTNNNPEGEDKMSQETIQALTTRAEAAEANAAKAHTDLALEKGKVTVLEAEKTALESQVSSLETEKTALESQVETANGERDRMKTQLDAATETATEKDTEITKLKQEAEENKVVIADGIAAREEYEKAYVEAYVAAVGDDCTPEDEEAQRETAKAFPIAVLKKKTEGLQKSAADNFPTGREVTKENSKSGAGNGNGSGEESGQYPVGV